MVCAVICRRIEYRAYLPPLVCVCANRARATYIEKTFISGNRKMVPPIRHVYCRPKNPHKTREKERERKRFLRIYISVRRIRRAHTNQLKFRIAVNLMYASRVQPNQKEVFHVFPFPPISHCCLLLASARD